MRFPGGVDDDLVERRAAPQLMLGGSQAARPHPGVKGHSERSPAVAAHPDRIKAAPGKFAVVDARASGRIDDCQQVWPPFRIRRRFVRPAAQAGPEPGGLGGGERRKKRQLIGPGPPRRAGGTAGDTGAPDAEDKQAVPGGVAPGHGTQQGSAGWQACQGLHASEFSDGGDGAATANWTGNWHHRSSPCCATSEMGFFGRAAALTSIRSIHERSTAASL